jgi:DNA processing protein
MAVPGSPLDPRSQGCNALIREGATLVQDAGEVIEVLTGFRGELRLPLEPRPPAAAPMASEAIEIAPLLGIAPIGVDELVRMTGASAAEVQLALVELELTGRLQRHAGGRVSLGA